MIKAFFFDVDGTLYDRHFHDIDRRLIPLFESLHEKGHLIGLASSRCQQECSHLPSIIRLFPFDIKILDGGALILDQNEQVIEKHSMDPELMKNLDQLCVKNHLTYRYSTQNNNYWGVKPDTFWHQLWNNLYLTTPVYKPYEADEVFNVIIRFQNEAQEKLILENIQDTQYVRYRDCYEIRNKEVDKSVAIQKIKEQYHIDQLICFGDGNNDIDMLKKADIGIAMGNAQDECKKVADIVIDPIHEGAIYKYFTENKIYKEG